MTSLREMMVTGNQCGNRQGGQHALPRPWPCDAIDRARHIEGQPMRQPKRQPKVPAGRDSPLLAGTLGHRLIIEKISEQLCGSWYFVLRGSDSGGRLEWEKAYGD
jgi:hypothetical protein